MTNRARRRLSPLFAGADSGAYTLPDDLLRSRRTLDDLDAERTRVGSQAPVDPEAALLDHLDDRLEVGQVPGDDLVELAARLQAIHNATNLAIMVLGRALDTYEDRVLSMVMSAGERVIVDHLRPALLDTLGAARGAARVLKGALPDQASLAAGHVGARVTEAARVMNAAADRYSAIRTGRRVLRDLGVVPTDDVDGVLGELANLPAVWPSYMRGEPPWPTDPAHRMVWLVTSDAQPWMPTPAEQDERWREWRTQVATGQAVALSRSTG